MSEKLEFGLDFGIDVSKLQKLSAEIIELKNVLNGLLNTSNHTISNTLLKDIEKVEERYNKFLANFTANNKSNTSLLAPTLNDLKRLQKEINEVFSNSPAVREYKQLSSVIDQNSDKLKQFKNIQLSLKDSSGSFMSMGNAIKEVDELKKKLTALKQQQIEVKKNSSNATPTNSTLEIKQLQEIATIKGRIKDIQSATIKDNSFKDTYKNFTVLQKEVNNYEKVLSRLEKKATKYVNTESDVKQFKNLEDAIRRVRNEQIKSNSTSNSSKGMDITRDSVSKLTGEYIKLLNSMSSTRQNLKSVNSIFTNNTVNTSMSATYRDMSSYSQKLLDFEIKRQKVAESIANTNKDSLNYVARMANMSPKDFSKQMVMGATSQKTVLRDIMSNIKTNNFIESKDVSQLKAMKILSKMSLDPNVLSMVNSVSRTTQTKIMNTRINTDIESLRQKMLTVGASTDLASVSKLKNIVQGRIDRYDNKNRPEIANMYKSLWVDVSKLTAQVNSNLSQIGQKHSNMVNFATQYKAIMSSVKSNPSISSLVSNRNALQTLINTNPNISQVQQYVAQRSLNNINRTLNPTTSPLISGSVNSNNSGRYSVGGSGGNGNIPPSNSSGNTMGGMGSVVPMVGAMSNDEPADILRFFRNLSTIYFGYRTLSMIVDTKDLYDFEKKVASFSVASERNKPELQSGIKNDLIRSNLGSPIGTNQYVENITEVVKTGRGYKEAMSLVDGATNLSIANFADLNTTVELLNNQFLALDLEVTSERMTKMSNRIHSALVNTALDIQDVGNAGRQSNTVLASLVSSADQFGTSARFKDLEDYSEQLGYLNLAIVGDLRQKGKTGGQGGTVERNFMTKLLQLDNTGSKRLDSDLSKASPELLQSVGFSSSKEMMQMAKSDIHSVIEGLSKLQEKGALSFSTISKMFTERHASSISSLLSDIDGNLDKFITKITTGKDVTKDANFAMKNWAVTIDALVNSFKNYKKTIFSGGILPGTIGAVAKTTGKGLDALTNFNTSPNPYSAVFSQTVQQSFLTTMLANMTGKFVRDRSAMKIRDTYGTAIGNVETEISRLQSTGASPSVINTLSSHKAVLQGEQAMNYNMIAGGGTKFRQNLGYLTANTRVLSNNLSQVGSNLSTASKNATLFGNGLKSALASLVGPLGPIAIIAGLNLAFIGATKLMEMSAKNKAIDSDLAKSKGTIEDMFKYLGSKEQEINKPYEASSNQYETLIDKYISKNQELLESMQVVKTAKDQTFKTVTEVSQDYFKSKYGKYEYEEKDTSRGKQLRDIYDEFKLGRESDLFAGVRGNKREFSSETVLFEKSLDATNKNLLDKTRTAIVNDYTKAVETQKKSIGLVLNKNYLNTSNEYLADKLTLSDGRNVAKLQDTISKRFQDNADKRKGLASKKKLDAKQTVEYDVATLFDDLSAEDLNLVFKNKQDVGINKNDNSREKIGKLIEASTSVDSDGKKTYDFNFIYGQIDKMKVSAELREKYISAIKEVANDYIAIDEAYLKQMNALIDVRDNSLQTLNNLRSQNRASVLTKIGMSYNFDFDKDSFEGNGRVFKLNAIRDSANATLKNELNTNPMLNKDLNTTIEYQSQLKSNIQQTFQLKEKLQIAREKYAKDELKMTASDKIGMQKQIGMLEESIRANEEAKVEIQKGFQLSIYNNATREQLFDLQKQNLVSSIAYKHQAGTAFGNRYGELASKYQSYAYDMNVFRRYGRDNLNAQISEGNKYLTENQKKFLGRDNFNNVSTTSALELQQQVLKAKAMNSNNVTWNNHTVSLKEAEELTLKMSSIASEQMAVRQKELELMQQRKAIEIELVKMQLEANKLHTTYVQSSSILFNEFSQQSLAGNRFLAGNTTTKSEDRERLLELKLVGQELKMNDQINQTKHGIKISIENTLKQIEAMRRIDGTITKSIDKVVSQIPTKIAPYFDRLNATLSNFISSANSFSTGGSYYTETYAEPANDKETASKNTKDAIIKSLGDVQGAKAISTSIPNEYKKDISTKDPSFGVFDMIARGETSLRAKDATALGRSSKDKDNTYSYGILGMNTGGSMQRFVQEYGKKLGLPNISYKSEEGRRVFKKIAMANPKAMYDAQTEYLYKYYIPDKVGTNLDTYMKKYVHPNLFNNEGVRAAITDTMVQQGVAGSIGAIMRGEFKSISDPKKFLDAQYKYEWDHYKGTFRTAISQGLYGEDGHRTRMNSRYGYAYNKIGVKYNPINFSSNSGFNGAVTTNPIVVEDKPITDSQKDMLSKINTMTGIDYTTTLRKDGNTLDLIATQYNRYITAKNENRGLQELKLMMDDLKKQALSYKTGDGDFEVVKDVISQLFSNLTQQLSDLRDNLVEQKRDFIETINGFNNTLNVNEVEIDQLNLRKLDAFKIISENEFTSWSADYQARLARISAEALDNDHNVFSKSYFDKSVGEAYIRALGYEEDMLKLTRKDGEVTKVLLQKPPADSTGIEGVVYDTLSPSEQSKLMDSQVYKYKSETNVDVIHMRLGALQKKFYELATKLTESGFYTLSQLSDLDYTTQEDKINAYLQKVNTELQSDDPKYREVFRKESRTLDEFKLVADVYKQENEHLNNLIQLSKEREDLERDYISHLQKIVPAVSSMYYDINKVDNSKVREHRYNMTSYLLASDGVNLESNYAKTLLSKRKLSNAVGTIKEGIDNFNVKLDTPEVKALYKELGLDSASLKLRGNDTVNMVRNYEILNKIRSSERLSNQEEFNKLYNSIKGEDTLGIFENADINTTQGLENFMNTLKSTQSSIKDSTMLDNISLLISRGTEMLKGNPILDSIITQLSDTIKQNTDALQESMGMYTETYKMGVGMISNLLFSKDLKQLDPSLAFNNLFSSPLITGVFTSILKRSEIQKAMKEVNPDGFDRWKSEGLRVNLHNQIVNKENEVLDPETLQPTKIKNKKGDLVSLKGTAITLSEILNLSLNGATVLDGIIKQFHDNKLNELKIQEQILTLNLQIADTTSKRRDIEQDILNNKLNQIQNEYTQKSGFMGTTSTLGYSLQGAMGGATQGSTFGVVGTAIGGAIGLFSGLRAGLNAKAQMSQEKASLVAQQKLTWITEDNNRYLKTIAEATSEQAKWTTKIGVGDATTRATYFALTQGDNTIGGTSSEQREVRKKDKKFFGLLKKTWTEPETYTSSINLSDSMFGGRQFRDRQDLEFALSTLGKDLVNTNHRYSPNRYDILPMYLDYRENESKRELNSNEFIKAFNQTDTLGNMGLLIDTNLESTMTTMLRNLENSMAGASTQERVNIKAKINFYDNLKKALDRENKTAKRLFGQYYGFETEDVKDEKGNVLEYRRVNEGMWSDYYSQVTKNSLEGANTFNTGGNFIQGTLSAFVQNVFSGKNSIKAITEDFSRLADEIYDVVSRTGEFSNVSGTIYNMVGNLKALTDQQKEVDKFTVDLAKRWVSVGGNITDVLSGMNNGLALALNGIRENLLGKSLEDSINSFGSSLFTKLSESLTTNLINKKYSNQIFDVNEKLTNAVNTNSVSDIVALGTMYKGVSAKAEADRQRIEALSRLFTANRNIDYMDEGINYETGTSQSINYNITNTNEFNIGTYVADDMTLDLFMQKIASNVYTIFKDLGYLT